VAEKNKDMWLKVLMTVLIALVVGSFTVGFDGRNKLDDKKVDKEVFDMHQEYQNSQFKDIKDSLKRIEDKP
jgi:hypothetical protein